MKPRPLYSFVSAVLFSTILIPLSISTAVADTLQNATLQSVTSDLDSGGHAIKNYTWYNPNNFPVTLFFTMSNCVNLLYPCDTESITVGALSSNTVDNVGLPRDDSKPANWTMTWTVKSISVGGSGAASSQNAPGSPQIVGYVPVVVPAPAPNVGDGIAGIVSGFSGLSDLHSQAAGIHAADVSADARFSQELDEHRKAVADYLDAAVPIPEAAQVIAASQLQNPTGTDLMRLLDAEFPHLSNRIRLLHVGENRPCSFCTDDPEPPDSDLARGGGAYDLELGQTLLYEQQAIILANIAQALTPNKRESIYPAMTEFIFSAMSNSLRPQPGERAPSYARRLFVEFQPILNALIANADQYPPGTIASVQSTLHSECTAIRDTGVSWNDVPVCNSPNRGW